MHLADGLLVPVGRVAERPLDGVDELAHLLGPATVVVDLDRGDHPIVGDRLVGGLEGREHLLDGLGLDDGVRGRRLVETCWVSSARSACAIEVDMLPSRTGMISKRAMTVMGWVHTWVGGDRWQVYG